CEAGTALLAKIGRLDHTPKNPGLPEDDFKLAYKGTSRSNLAQGFRSLSKAVDLWMDDSDAGDVKYAVHRRRCLNPAMQKTGCARTDEFSALYVCDQERKKVPEYDFVAWPARGPMPVEYFKAGQAWTVSFDPRSYNPPGDKVTATVHAADEKGN